MHLFNFGAHRGATAVATALLRTGGSRLTVLDAVDPKPGRASALCEVYGRRSGLVTRAHEARCEEFVARVPAGVPVVVSVDELGALSTLASAAIRQPMFVQILGRGARASTEVAPAVGLNITLVTGRERERDEAAALLTLLARLAPPQSSAVLREDPLSSMNLHTVREGTGAVTASRLLDLPRTVEAEYLSTLLWREVQLPLVIRRREDPLVHRGVEQALDLAPRGRRAAVVLLGNAPRVDFYVVSPRRSGPGFIELALPFQRVLPAPRESSAGSSTRSSTPAAPAAFTD